VTLFDRRLQNMHTAENMHLNQSFVHINTPTTVPSSADRIYISILKT
jgi:hypothetical protein